MQRTLRFYGLDSAHHRTEADVGDPLDIGEPVAAVGAEVVLAELHGAAAHGIAAALLEEFIYDENGQLLTSSFMDYLKPTAADLPTIEGDRLETPSPLTLLGTAALCVVITLAFGFLGTWVALGQKAAPLLRNE